MQICWLDETLTFIWKSQMITCDNILTGVIQKPVPYLQYITTPLTVKSQATRINRPQPHKISPTKKVSMEPFSSRSFSVATSGNRTGILYRIS